MSCPTCDHTMQSVGQLVNDGRIYWCPRCGTLRWREHGKETDSVPKLPGRVVELLEWMEKDDPAKEVAWTFGVVEACQLPKDRT